MLARIILEAFILLMIASSILLQWLVVWSEWPRFQPRDKVLVAVLEGIMLPMTGYMTVVFVECLWG